MQSDLSLPQLEFSYSITFSTIIAMSSIQCPPLPVPANAVSLVYTSPPDPSNYNLDTVALYNCNENTTMAGGSAYRKCIVDSTDMDVGIWSGEEIICEGA